MKAIILGIVALALRFWLIPVVPVNLFSAFLIVIFGFFFRNRILPYGRPDRKQ